MISFKHRFHGHGSLRLLYQRGQVIRNQKCLLRYLPSKHSSYRVAVVVSRKVHKSAVVRNRIRRRLYEIVRTYEGDFIKPYDLMFIVLSDELATEPHEVLQRLMYGHLLKAGVLDASTRVAHGIVKSHKKES